MEKLGKDLTEKEFRELCFEFGIELDEVTSEYDEILREKGKDSIELKEASKDILYKIEVPANRYDLLCIEGLTRALRIFLGLQKHPNYKTIKPSNDKIYTMKVTKSTKKIRPYIVAAVLRNITFTQKSYDSFIKLQDKLHFNICSKRKLVAIGTHDLDTLKPNFLYDARKPKDISFIALKETKEMNAEQLFDEYRKRGYRGVDNVCTYIYNIFMCKDNNNIYINI